MPKHSLRIMLANLRRKVGMAGGAAPAPPPATMQPPQFAENMIMSPTYVDPSLPQPFSMEELGIVWPSERGFFSPSAIPPWLQEQVSRLWIHRVYRVLTRMCRA